MRETNPSTHPPNRTEGHTSVVGDVAWHQQNPKLLGSVGDDKQLLFWDTSIDGAKPTTVIPNVRGEERDKKKQKTEQNRREEEKKRRADTRQEWQTRREEERREHKRTEEHIRGRVAEQSRVEDIVLGKGPRAATRKAFCVRGMFVNSGSQVLFEAAESSTYYLGVGDAQRKIRGSWVGVSTGFPGRGRGFLGQGGGERCCHWVERGRAAGEHS